MPSTAQNRSSSAFASSFRPGRSSPASLEGRGVIGAARKMLGPTETLDAPPGTIRGDYGVHWRRNLCHASDSEESAAREIALWFRDDELAPWDQTNARWLYELPSSKIKFGE